MIRFTKDVMAELKNAGFSEYKLRQENLLPSSTIKALKAWDTGISMRSLNAICELLGGVQPQTFLEYYDPSKDTKTIKNYETGFACIRQQFGKPY